jgi:hypothetical protein
MIASEIAANHALSNLGHRIENKSSPPAVYQDTGKAYNSLRHDQTDKVNFTSGKFQSVKSRLNLVARNIRDADETMGEIETYIDKMKAQLEKIVKNFPPFPPGSEERMEKLRTFHTFRKQIDEMTIPPNEVFLMQKQIAESGDLEDAEDENGSLKGIPGHKVHPGSSELDILELSEDATDDEIIESMVNLGNAKVALRQRRIDLYTITLGIKNGNGGGAEIAEENISVLKGMEVKVELMSNSTGGLTEAHQQLTELLN